MARSLILVSALLSVFLSGSALAAPLQIVGHRGYSAFFPENTLRSLSAAFEAGADIVEIDLQKSSDGSVVIIHDATLDRTTNGTGAVADFTVAELQALDAGSWLDPRFSDETIPTLEEALVAAMGWGPLLLDQKSDLVFGAELADALSATGFPIGQVWVTAWNEVQVADVIANVPGATILWTALFPPLPHRFAMMAS